MKAAIIEDEQVHKKLLSEYLLKWSKDSGISIDITEFDSAESFLFQWEENTDFDILFVDIQMKEINGIEMARRIRQQDSDIVIIFTTGLSDYMEEGYEVEALQYLIKPVNEEKLRKCLNRVLQKKKVEQFVVVNTKDGVRKLNADNIVYLEARGHNTLMELIAKEGEKELREEQKLLPENTMSCGTLRQSIIRKVVLSLIIKPFTKIKTL